jgi:hypothetical protein
MSNWSEQQFTRKGAELRAKVEAGKCKLALTKMKIGNGSVTVGEIEHMTDLKSPQLVFGISSCTVSEEDSTVCKTVGIASSSNVENSFSVSEMGLYATDPDIGEILYLVCIDSAPDTMPNKRVAAPVTLTYQFDIVTSNTANVTAMITPTGLATAKMVNEHRTAAELDHPEKSVRKKHLHPDAYESPALTGTPTTPTAERGTNNGQIASTAFVAQAIAALVNSAPGGLDTLQELAAALGNDANFAATVTNVLAGKVSKSGSDTIDGRLTALSFFTRNWFRAIGNNSGLLFEDYGGGWTMSDPEWLRSHNGKGVYTSGQMKADSGFVGTASNANNLGNKSLQWIIDQINAAKTGIIASNLAQNGWVKFANGLIVQWGVGTEVSGEQQFDIALPIAFQNACFSVSVTVIQSRGVSSNYGEDFQVIEYNRDKIKLYLQHFELNAKPAKPLYIAIGV